jgi:hypothetical protein
MIACNARLSADLRRFDKRVVDVASSLFVIEL